MLRSALVVEGKLPQARDCRRRTFTHFHVSYAGPFWEGLALSPYGPLKAFVRSASAGAPLSESSRGPRVACGERNTYRELVSGRCACRLLDYFVARLSAS